MLTLKKRKASLVGDRSRTFRFPKGHNARARSLNGHTPSKTCPPGFDAYPILTVTPYPSDPPSLHPRNSIF